MKIRPGQLDIPAEKITEYLLVKKEKNDKSKFLLSLGYSLNNWQGLINDIKNIAVNNNIVLERESEFGNFYLWRIKKANWLLPFGLSKLKKIFIDS